MSVAATASPARLNRLHYANSMNNGVRKRKSLQHSVQNLEANIAGNKTPKLPLKKRFYAEEMTGTSSVEKIAEINLNIPKIVTPVESIPINETKELKIDQDDCNTESDDTPVDFSLPNRVRAKSTPSKNSVKSEPGLVHSPSDTTAASVSPSNSDETSPKVPEESSSASSFPQINPLLLNQAQLQRQSAFTPTSWNQHSAFLEALRLSNSGRLSTIPPFFGPALGLGAFPLVPPNLGSLAGSLAPGGASLFPPAGQIFQNNSPVDLNLLKTLSLAAAAASTSVQSQAKTELSSESSGKTSQSPGSFQKNFCADDSGQDDSFHSDAYPETFVINPATGNKVRKNYKNMTRERRVEANARERTRVHTIGSAFDNIRKLIPCLAPDQKLSKLSILRIACKYILLLAAMNGEDYSADQRGYTVEECAEMLNETIVAESKAKRMDR